MNNKQIAESLVKHADNDFDVMVDLYDKKRYTYCLFFGHLALEKLLKAIYAKRNAGFPHAPKTHDLLVLAKKCNLELNEDTEDKLELVTTFNIAARYQEQKEDFYKQCTKEFVDEQIKNIKETRIWLKEKLTNK